MKKLLIIECVLAVISLCGFILAFASQKAMWFIFQEGIIFGGITLCLYLTIEQHKIQKFLVQQTKPSAGKEEQNLNRILQQSIELSTLQSQINPHFLYNTLDSIRGEALISGQKEIAEMTEKLSKFFRYCISNKGNIVRLSEEINHVKDYFFIQHYRFGDKLNMRISVEDDALLEYYVPKIILQPIVENAISHGIEGVKRPGTIEIHIYATEKKMFIHVTDNGKGMPEEQLEKLNSRLENNQVEVSVSNEKRTGIGIKNINSRVRICFGEEYGLHYRSLLDIGTNAEIILPLVDDFSREKYENKLRRIS